MLPQESNFREGRKRFISIEERDKGTFYRRLSSSLPSTDSWNACLQMGKFRA
ncbi:Hypothetical protein FKW44_012776 [Caligus rogercresseyi]|uniref:Uncharacterized protein n=1 Tax=Caligus rogercresseyi TaxID=217165 RepID=A0A7T8GL59_CALRO|nr:Hypothetical protein FKW44_024659 [Caligus rogercresseyi]QQP37962.1 Hypothetical protein FKW44_018415 [Caligus rogercresseyi]QQP40910.1 Hypothetical protein FKW44_015118 [Caligus rogercresseyi]QQP48862.1 Hypothetical protein FKW44_009313 [Caligus rogercresseyi]QQP51418.1 Hypothetical protein FKW44_012775 [Caligus rogercresseyi]